MGKQILIAVAVLVIAAAGAGGVWWQQSTEASGQQAARPASKVNVVYPRMAEVQDVVESVGTLQAREDVVLSAEVSGRVVALAFNEGAAVDKGQLLVQLDDRQARADLQVAEAQLRDARTKYDRASRLQGRGSISQSEVDELRTALSVAEAQRIAASTRLDNHRIGAPFAGVVGLTDVSVGTYLDAGDSIATLDAIDPMELTFSIPERYLGQISMGQTLRAGTAAYAGRSFDGALSEMDSRLNPLTRSLPVKAVIDNPDGVLRPGLFMAVSLTLDTRRALVIPEQAVMTRGDSQYVFLAVDGQARRQPVELGTRSPGRVEVASGLSESDAVVITGQDRLSSGDAVEVIEGENALIGGGWPDRQEG
ncbi:efflux RND transporter periplasmic adaptor subunit [Marinobacter sp. JSM 1782161]|uniref:efflux RND transporter periplasmic adaptor subunit n=1 Tax=Marinobacter sp. JSM 1782161 TaxID=2685906 RepID=UPI001403ED6A|nr:efflux RND transporter periplasmic adaptor subunit [Marinobacter sp. JSM 1782161]